MRLTRDGTAGRRAGGDADASGTVLRPPVGARRQPVHAFAVRTAVCARARRLRPAIGRRPRPRDARLARLGRRPGRPGPGGAAPAPPGRPPGSPSTAGAWRPAPPARATELRRGVRPNSHSTLLVSTTSGTSAGMRAATAARSVTGSPATRSGGVLRCAAAAAPNRRRRSGWSGQMHASSHAYCVLVGQVDRIGGPARSSATVAAASGSSAALAPGASASAQCSPSAARAGPGRELAGLLGLVAVGVGVDAEQQAGAGADLQQARPACRPPACAASATAG